MTNSSIDFSISPNAEYFVSRPEGISIELEDIIDTTKGGVFGLTGVRGAGKSVLMKKIEENYKGIHHTLQITAPVSAKEETAFFSMMFRQLCRSVVDYIDSSVLGDKKTLTA